MNLVGFYLADGSNPLLYKRAFSKKTATDMLGGKQRGKKETQQKRLLAKTFEPSQPSSTWFFSTLDFHHTLGIRDNYDLRAN